MQRATDEQQAIIQAPLDRHMKVVAVAGAGKSTTMVQRLLWMAQEGVNLSRVLVIMFNRAARLDFEMKVKRYIPGDEPQPRVRTFHSLGFQLCQRFIKARMLSKRRLVDSDGWAEKLARDCLLEVLGEPQGHPCNPFRPGIPEELLGFHDVVKSDLHSPEECFASRGMSDSLRAFLTAYPALEAMMHREGLRFYSDLIYEPVTLMRDNPEALALVTNRVDYVIVDECQDINPISQVMLHQVAGSRAWVTAVGDDDQTIYEFRGATPSFLINGFDQLYPDPLDFKLTRTFRYGHAIAAAANHVIRHNQARVPKLNVAGEGNPASRIDLWMDSPTAATRTHERPLIRHLLEQQRQGKPLRDTAILVRVFSAASTIELQLLEERIPYRFEGGESVLHHRHTEGLLAVLRLADDSLWTLPVQDQVEALLRFLMLPHPGVAHHLLRDLAARIVRNPQQLGPAFDNTLLQVKETYRGRLAEKRPLLERLIATTERDTARLLGYFLQETDCLHRAKEDAPRPRVGKEDRERLEAVQRFCVAHGGDCSEVRAHIDTLAGREPMSEDDDAVLLTSVHRSKGLEWPTVIMPDLSDASFPYVREGVALDMEAERRLFYVGMTRAQERLILITPHDRDLAIATRGCYGRSLSDVGLGKHDQASHFVYEANLHLSACIAKACEGDPSALRRLPPLLDVHTANAYLAASGSGQRLTPNQTAGQERHAS